jgi:hypothetical protein
MGGPDMGTSASRRPPDVPRWRSVSAAAAAAARGDGADGPGGGSGGGDGRVLAELLNAARGDGWLNELGAGAVLQYARAAERAWAALPEALLVEGPETAVRRLVNDARAASLDSDSHQGLAAAVAERAFARTLIGTFGPEVDVMTASGAEAAAAWQAKRGPAAGAMSARFLGELVHQMTAHLFGSLSPAITPQVYPDARQARAAARRLAETARDAAAPGAVVLVERGADRAWTAAVAQAWRAAGRLPGDKP